MAKARYPSDEAYRFLMRMPDELREKLAAAAEESGRSMNAEALARLEKSFDDNSAAKAMAEMVERHEEEISSLWRDMEDMKASVSSLYRR